MGTGEMIITIGAIILLGNIIMTTNRGIGESSQTLLLTSYGIDAISLATSIIQNAEKLDFDEKTKDSVQINSPTQLTTYDSLGYDSGTDSTVGPDDVDDYNGPDTGSVTNRYRIEYDTLATGVYAVKTQVHYVSLASMETYVKTQTYYKRLDIWVWNKDETNPMTINPKTGIGTPDTLARMATILSYWVF
jgi:hypothetical protein